VKVIILDIFVATMSKLQQVLAAPVASSQFVLAAHYDFSITSRLAKNI